MTSLCLLRYLAFYHTRPISNVGLSNGSQSELAGVEGGSQSEPTDEGLSIEDPTWPQRAAYRKSISWRGKDFEPWVEGVR